MNGDLWLAGGSGLILGWLGRALGAARARSTAVRIANDRRLGFETELLLAQRDLELAATERAGLARDVGAATQTIELLRIESEAHLRALEQARADGDRAAVRRDLVVAECSALADRVAELESVVAEIEDLRREGRALSAERARLAERLEQLTLQYHRLESERTRSVLMADVAESQLKQLAESAQTSRSLQATELLDVKRHLAGAVAEADQFRRELAALASERDALARRIEQADADRRTGALSHQAAIAALQAELGSAHALAERVEPLRRQLEDREGLIRSLAGERDEATRSSIRQERASFTLRADLEREVARLQAAATDALAQARRVAAAENQLAAAVRERDTEAAAARQTRAEVESFRSELKDRDLRFRTLLNDRRHFAEQSQDQIARLREDMVRARLAGGDDLQRITGIGPSLERRLKRHGITTFQQIASWSEIDIERISKELGPFAHRIRRDRWIEQARQVGSLEGEPAA